MNEPSPQHDQAEREITGPVRDYLAALLDALTVPLAATDGHAEEQLLRERVGWVTVSLRGLLSDDESEDGDVTFDVGYLRQKTEETPVTYTPYTAPENGEPDGGQG